MAETELMTIDEAARYLKVCRKTLYRWLRAGRLKGYRVGRQWRLRRADLDRWLEENQAGESDREAEGLWPAGEKEAAAGARAADGQPAAGETSVDAAELLEEIREQLVSAGQRTFSAAEVVAMIERARRRAMEGSR